jgi:hypothetical protein
MPAWLPATFTVTVLPLQTVGVAGVTIGVVNGKWVDRDAGRC